VVVRFVDIGGIVDHHTFKLFCINLSYLGFLQPFDKYYSRNVSCALNLISTLLLKKEKFL